MCRRCGTPRPAAAMAVAGGCYGGGGAVTAMAGGGDMRPGDWMCPACGDHQFAKNDSCRRCGMGKSGGCAAAGGAVAYGGNGYAAQKQLAWGGAADSGAGAGAGGAARAGDWICGSCGDLQFARNTTCRRCGQGSPSLAVASVTADVGAGATAYSAGALPPGAGNARPGDWICGSCGDLQFARNTSCRRCGQMSPSIGGLTASMDAGAGALPPAAGNARPGDWICGSCGDLQFARNTTCRRCGQVSPSAGGMFPTAAYGGCAMAAYSTAAPCGGCGGCGGTFGGDSMRPGDWTCPNCQDHVFAKNDACRRCATPRPTGGGGGVAIQASPKPLGGFGSGLKPGDWYCPACQDLQFARNMACRLCSTPKPEEGVEAGADNRVRSRSPYRAAA